MLDSNPRRYRACPFCQTESDRAANCCPSCFARWPHGWLAFLAAPTLGAGDQAAIVQNAVPDLLGRSVAPFEWPRRVCLTCGEMPLPDFLGDNLAYVKHQCACGRRLALTFEKGDKTHFGRGIVGQDVPLWWFWVGRRAVPLLLGGMALLLLGGLGLYAMLGGAVASDWALGGLGALYGLGCLGLFSTLEPYAKFCRMQGDYDVKTSGADNTVAGAAAAGLLCLFFLALYCGIAWAASTSPQYFTAAINQVLPFGLLNVLFLMLLARFTQQLNGILPALKTSPRRWLRPFWLLASPFLAPADKAGLRDLRRAMPAD